MLIRVVKIELDNYIKAESAYGFLSGYWNGAKVNLLSEYWVELEISHIYSFEEVHICQSNASEVIIGELNGANKIIGFVDAYEDNVLTVKIGESIVLLETEDDVRFNSLCGKYITFIANRLDIYDVNS